MKRIQDFYTFVNESSIGMHFAFTFIPVDNNFKSIESNLVNSKTPLPSESFMPGTYGYILMPTTHQTQELLLSQWFNQNDNLVDGRIGYINGPDDEGIIINGGEPPAVTHSYSPLSGVTSAPSRSTGKSSISSEIPGFSNSTGIFLKSGTALMAEIMLRKHAGWEPMEVKDVKKKLLNGFPDNTCLSVYYLENLEYACGEIRSILASVSPKIGLKLKKPIKLDITDDLLDFFEKKPGEFVSMNFPPGVFDKISELAKRKKPDQNVAQTIDNIKDLKSSGLFDD